MSENEQAVASGPVDGLGKAEAEREATEAAVDQEIREKGLTAPRVTPADIDALIVDEAYHRFPGTTVTVCVLTLRNGFNTVGHSACASEENYDEELGRKIARANARDVIWPLAGYELRQAQWLKAQQA